MIDLKNILVDSKSVVLAFPGIENFSVTVSHVSKDTVNKIREKCTSYAFDRKTRTQSPTFDGELFIKEFSKLVIKSWTGLKLKDLESLVVVDISGQNPEEELPYTEDNAFYLLVNSNEFDAWLNEVVFDLDNFRTGAGSATVRSAEAVSGQ